MKSLRSFAALACLTLFAPLATAQELDEILASMREARGPLEQPVVMEGTCERNGLDETFSIALTPDGAFRFDSGGPLSLTNGFDGEIAWTKQWSNPTRRLVLTEADRITLASWVLTGHWLDEGAPVEIALAEGGEALALLLSSPAGLEMRVSVDRETWLPAGLNYHNEGGEDGWVYEAWGAVGERKLPFRWTHTDSGGLADVYTVREGRAAPDLDRGRFAFRREEPSVRFVAERPAELETKRARTGHMLVHPRVEGKDVGWFILDSGAGAMCIDPKVADELELEAMGRVTAVGVAGRTTTDFRQGKRFALGRFEMDDPLYVALDLAFLEPFFGVKVAGIVGYDLFARSVVEIEPATAAVAVYDRKGFAAGEAWRELVLDNRLPCVPCRFEGDREGLFRLDTGAMGTVAFDSPAVERFGLLDGRPVESSIQGGVGGTGEVLMGEIEWFELGGHRFEKPVAGFSRVDKGALANRYTCGVIGNELLDPFRIVFDYQGERIAFVKRGE